MRVEIVPVTPIAQNCTILWNDGDPGAVVIDPGGEADKIAARLAAHGLVLQAIWLTHGHLDHAGGAEALRALGNPAAQIVGPHRADQFLLDSIVDQAAKFGISGLGNAKPDRWLDDGDRVSLGSEMFEVLHCPGHTPGHVVFVNRPARFAQLGDVLFAGSVGRTDFPYGDHAALIASITAKLMPLEDDIQFVCGHGPHSTIGRERSSNPFLR